MTIEFTAPLMQAVEARLTSALQGKGIPDGDGAAAPDVPVFTDVTTQKIRIYVRLEGFSMIQGGTRVGHSDRHTFLCRVVHQQVGKAITQPGLEIPRIEGVIASALKKWRPLANASGIRFVTSFEADDPDPSVTARVSRYQLIINGD